MSDGEAFHWTPFTHGYVFWEHSTPEYHPPGPDDIKGLRQWLEGFELSHAEHPDVIVDLSDPNAEEAGESVAEALNRLLAGHPVLATLLAMRRPM
jgi:hypothetical protein